MEVAGDLFIARRQRCASTSPPPLALTSPRKTHARDLLYFHHGLLELPSSVSAELRLTLKSLLIPEFSMPESAALLEVDAVRAFNEIVAKETSLHSVITPIGDGLWVGVKH